MRARILPPMFRRTLLVFLGLVLLVLAATLGYALLGLAGPESHLEAAREEAALGQHARAIRLLDTAERSLGPASHDELVAKLLDLRYHSYLEVGNYAPALRDIVRLRRHRPDDAELIRTQVRWTVVAGDPEHALELARAFLDEHPTDGEMLELAGEASQAIYQRDLRRLLAEVGAALDPGSAEQAFAAIRSWLYRDRRDPVANLAIDRFVDVLRAVRPELAATGRLQEELRRIRDSIWRTLDYFRLALESDAEPTAAYAGVAYALRQARRDDDLQWLAEIYLHRFDHVFAATAAVHLADLHLARGRHAAVLELRERFLPPGAWLARVEAGTLDGRVAGLLLAQARALAALGDTEALAALAAEAEAMHEHPLLSLEPDLHWIRAIAARAAGDTATAVRSLNEYERALAQATQNPDVVERRIQVTNERIELGKERGFGPEFFNWAYQTLARLDANDPRPVLEQTRYHIAQDDPAGALLELQSARRVAAHDEEVLHLQAAALDAQREKVGQGAAVQLARCIELGIDVPLDVPEVQLLPIAEHALESGNAEVALACARRAAERFSWAKWPRQLIVRAAFALEQPEVAMRAAEAILAFHPGDVDALLALRSARRALGQSSQDLVYDLLVAGREDAATARVLLENALRRGDGPLATALAGTIERRYQSDPEALLAVAGVQAADGEFAAARKTLIEAGELAVRHDQQAFLEAYDRYLLLTAASVADPDELQSAVEQAIALHADDPAALTRLARELHELDRPAQAYLMLTPVLEDPRHAQARTGAHNVLAGRIALELGLTDAAEERFLAAMSFEDGQAVASRMLTLLQLERGRTREAAESFWEDEATDLVSAAVLTLTGRRNAAARWLRPHLQSNPADAAALALAAIVTPRGTLPDAFRELAERHRDALLHLLVFVDADGFENTAVERARSLVGASAGNPVARILLARARVRAGATAAALDELEDVLQDHPLLIPAYEEAVTALDAGEGEMLANAPIVRRLVDPELLQSGLATRRMVAFATRQRAGELAARLREQAGALEELAALWLRAPAGTATSLDQIDVLAAAGRPDLALRLCDAIFPHVEPDQRRRYLVTYFSLAALELLEHEDPELLATARERALAALEQDCALGVIVHFLIDRDLLENGPLGEPRDPIRVRKLTALLERHLERVRSGDPKESAMLLRTLERYAELQGRRAAIDAATARLRADPSLIGVWIQRARWLAQEGESQRAIDDIRWIHRYVPTHPAVLDCIELSAREGVIHEDDVAAVSGELLADSILESPSGLLTRGLLALRRADYTAAIELLAKGAECADGAHLFYRGLACMPLGRIDEARALLEQCAELYPQSPLTSLAGHFARQLSH